MAKSLTLLILVAVAATCLISGALARGGRSHGRKHGKKVLCEVYNTTSSERWSVSCSDNSSCESVSRSCEEDELEIKICQPNTCSEDSDCGGSGRCLSESLSSSEESVCDSVDQDKLETACKKNGSETAISCPAGFACVNQTGSLEDEDGYSTTYALCKPDADNRCDSGSSSDEESGDSGSSSDEESGGSRSSNRGRGRGGNNGNRRFGRGRQRRN